MIDIPGQTVEDFENVNESPEKLEIVEEFKVEED